MTRTARSIIAGVDGSSGSRSAVLSADVLATNLRGTYFGQRFVDMIDYNATPAAGEPNYSNVARASADGGAMAVASATAIAERVLRRSTLIVVAVTTSEPGRRGPAR